MRRMVSTTSRTPIEALREGAPLWRWCRSLDPALATYADELARGTYFNLRVNAAVGEVVSLVDDGLADAGLDDRPERRLLARDVGSLAELFARTAVCDEVEVRVEHDPSARCPVFHQDNNVLRLLCTYAGPGTEWLPEAHLDRSQLGVKGRTPADANHAIAIEAPERSRPGEVLIVKGARFDASHGSLVHKSPAPELGARLFVAVDRASRAPAVRSCSGGAASWS